jgi:hypothetical protein
MFRDRKGVHGKKGMMKRKKVLSELYGRSGYWKDRDLVVHFRFGTHGLMDRTATHPFPITADTGLLTATTWKSPSGLAHNGIINGFGDKMLSDTQDFIRRELSCFATMPDQAEVLAFLKAKGGKYALMTERNTHLVGDFLQDQGCYWSNSGYKEVEREYRLPSYSGWSDYAKKWKKDKSKSWEDDWKDGPGNADICSLTGRPSDYTSCERCDYFDDIDFTCKINYQ